MRRALAVAIGLVAAATLAGFFDRLSWVFEPFVLFRAQYAVLAVLLAAAAFAARGRRLAAVALAAAAVNVAAVAPWHGAPSRTVAAGDPTLRVVVFNVNASNHRYDKLAPLVADLRPDVLGLTELTPGWARAAAAASDRLRPRRFVVRDDDYGMGVLTVPPADVTAEHFPADGPVALIARLIVAGRPLTFVLVHAHTPFAGSVHARELRALAAARPTFGARLVVCGDFNTVPWSAQLGDFAESAGLVDVFQGSWPTYSWPSWSPLLRVPLDHCLIGEGLAVRSRSFGPSSGSDHFPLVVDLAVTALPR